MIQKRSITIHGHRTSVSVEDRFWERLTAIAGERGYSVARLVASLDTARSPDTNLSSAIRLFVLDEALRREDLALQPEPPAWFDAVDLPAIRTATDR